MTRDIVTQFADAINKHDAESLASLMTDDHTFIDAQGNVIQGKDTMKKGWLGYFGWFPDYKIEITEIFESGNKIGLFGFAGGTYKGINTETNYCRMPAAWKAEVEKNKVKLWQVYADTKIPLDIIAQAEKNT
jgi:hypothetical protein